MHFASKGSGIFFGLENHKISQQICSEISQYNCWANDTRAIKLYLVVLSFR